MNEMLKKKVTLSLSESGRMLLRGLAADYGLSLSGMVEVLLRDKRREHEEQVRG